MRTALIVIDMQKDSFKRRLHYSAARAASQFHPSKGVILTWTTPDLLYAVGIAFQGLNNGPALSLISDTKVVDPHWP